MIIHPPADAGFSRGAHYLAATRFDLYERTATRRMYRRMRRNRSTPEVARDGAYAHGAELHAGRTRIEAQS